MACNSSLTPTDWFELNLDFLIRTTEVEDCWPWLNITKEDITGNQSLRNMNIVLKIVQVSILVISPIGIIGSLCSIFAVWRKTFKAKERFYAWMFAVAVNELLFNVLYIFVALRFGYLFENVYKYSYWATKVMCIMAGIVYAFSLSADLCTLVLTVDRFIVICKPTKFPKLVNKKLLYSLTIIGFITCVPMRLIRYAFEYTASESGIDYTGHMTYTQSIIDPSAAYNRLVFVVDILLPFILLIIMVYFSTQIAYVIIRRKRSKVHDNASTRQRNVQEQSKATLRLLVILVLLFVCNQFGYCLWAVTSLVARDEDPLYSISLTDFAALADANFYLWVCTMPNYICESCARALHFFFYYAFSASIRREFKKFMHLQITGGVQ